MFAHGICVGFVVILLRKTVYLDLHKLVLSLEVILLRSAVYLDLHTCRVWWSSYWKRLFICISTRVEFDGYLTEKGCLFGSPHVWRLMVILLRKAVLLDLHTREVWWSSY